MDMRHPLEARFTSREFYVWACRKCAPETAGFEAMRAKFNTYPI
jgi:hypothetical protein